MLLFLLSATDSLCMKNKKSSNKKNRLIRKILSSFPSIPKKIKPFHKKDESMYTITIRDSDDDDISVTTDGKTCGATTKDSECGPFDNNYINHVEELKSFIASLPPDRKVYTQTEENYREELQKCFFEHANELNEDTLQSVIEKLPSQKGSKIIFLLCDSSEEGTDKSDPKAKEKTVDERIKEKTIKWAQSSLLRNFIHSAECKKFVKEKQKFVIKKQGIKTATKEERKRINKKQKRLRSKKKKLQSDLLTLAKDIKAPVLHETLNNLEIEETNTIRMLITGIKKDDPNKKIARNIRRQISERKSVIT